MPQAADQGEAQSCDCEDEAEKHFHGAAPLSDLHFPLYMKECSAGARLYVRSIRDSEGNELFYFEVPFDKYLQSKSGSMN